MLSQHILKYNIIGGLSLARDQQGFWRLTTRNLSRVVETIPLSQADFSVRPIP